jgi:hypothetical protein
VKGIHGHRARRLFMKTLTYLKRYGDSYSHLHPQHTVFSPVAGFVLALWTMENISGNSAVTAPRYA